MEYNPKDLWVAIWEMRLNKEKLVITKKWEAKVEVSVEPGKA